MTLLLSLLLVVVPCDAESAGIRFVDAATGRGVPLVAVSTVDDVTWISDNDGWVAIEEPQLAGQQVFLRIDAPGYDVPKDGFGMAGVRVELQAGLRHTVALPRTQLAERLYRITGRDQYRDSIRLGLRSAETAPAGNGLVVGQDSVQAAVYRERMHWFWGDTNRLSYPLGLYRTAGAVSESPQRAAVDPAEPVSLTYFTDGTGFARSMVDVPNREGVVWIHGVCTVRDADGRDRLVAQYSRRKGLSDPLEQGLLLWNDERELFDVLQTIALDESWRILSDHPITVTEDGVEYLCFGNPFPVVRVPATLEAIQNREAYEAWSCRPVSTAANLTREEVEASRPERDADGQLIWRWQSGPPVTQVDERRWLKQGAITIEECRFLPDDARRVVQMHSGTVRFNAHRRRWVMIAIEHAWDSHSPSFLGEVFYSEADSPQGPFRHAVKIATHPGQSFYNPCHHDVFDQDGGRVIYFEGTYCNTFTKSPATPRYNYNQLMYRLDLSQIEAVFGSAR